MDKHTWESPDGNIFKEIISVGILNKKPTDNSECTIELDDYPPKLLEEFNMTKCANLIIGDSNTKFRRLLDICLTMMNKDEVAKVTFRCKEPVTFTLRLISFVPSKLIYEMNAKEKVELSLKHRQRGNELFKDSRHIDASHRFGRALKILCSIPIEVDQPPVEKDGVKITEIDGLKVILYNNLASCYLKHCDYDTVIQLCEDIFKIDKENIKALYKYGVAWFETHDYEKAQKSLLRVLELDSSNKAAADKLKMCNFKLQETNARVNAMIKKMFIA